MLMVTTTLIMVLNSTFIMMMEKIYSNHLLKSSFECGFNSINQKKMTFSTNFLLIAMLFLIFDIEITFLIPMIMSNNSTITWNLPLATMFLLVLTILLTKEWKQGSLEWSK